MICQYIGDGGEFMESIDLAKTFEMLMAKDSNAAYGALRILQDLSEETDAVCH